MCVPCSSFVRLEVGTVLTLCTARTVTFHKNTQKTEKWKKQKYWKKNTEHIYKRKSAEVNAGNRKKSKRGRKQKEWTKMLVKTFKKWYMRSLICGVLNGDMWTVVTNDGKIMTVNLKAMQRMDRSLFQIKHSLEQPQKATEILKCVHRPEWNPALLGLCLEL